MINKKKLPSTSTPQNTIGNIINSANYGTIILLFFSLIWTSTCLYADEAYETFVKANSLLQEHNPTKAAELYQKLIALQKNKAHSTNNPANTTLNRSVFTLSPALLYNAGIAQYALNNYAQALALWRKAEKSASPDLLQKIKINLQTAQTKLNIKHDNFFYMFCLSVQAYYSVLLAQILFLLFWFLFWVTYYSKQQKTIPKFIKLKYLFLLLSLLASSALLIKYFVHSSTYLVITAKEASVYIGPDATFDICGTVTQGQEVKLVDEKESWYKIQYYKKDRDKNINARGWIKQGASAF